MQNQEGSIFLECQFLKRFYLFNWDTQQVIKRAGAGEQRRGEAGSTSPGSPMQDLIKTDRKADT